MKKLMKSLFAFITCALLVIPTLATEGTFVPSISYKGAPDLVTLRTEDGKEVVGYVTSGDVSVDENGFPVVGEDGKVLSTMYRSCYTITSLEQALDENSDISETIRQSLISIYNQFLDGEIKLSEECPELNDVVATALGEGNNADNLVIRDLFDIDLINLVCKDNLDPENVTVDLTLDVDIEKGTYITVIQYKNGAWRQVEKVVNNNDNDITEDDGTITVTFEDFCPVAILVPGQLVEIPAEQPGFPWYIILVVIALAVVGFVVKNRKKAA